MSSLRRRQGYVLGSMMKMNSPDRKNPGSSLHLYSFQVIFRTAPVGQTLMQSPQPTHLS